MEMSREDKKNQAEAAGNIRKGRIVGNKARVGGVVCHGDRCVAVGQVAFSLDVHRVRNSCLLSTGVTACGIILLFCVCPRFGWMRSCAILAPNLFSGDRRDDL